MVVALLPAACLAGQAAPTFARVDAYRNVEILDLDHKTWRRVHRVAEWATDLTVSPSGDRLAFLSWAEPDSSLLRSELVVVDISGKVIASSIKQVQRYAWCGPTVGLHHRAASGEPPRLHSRQHRQPRPRDRPSHRLAGASPTDRDILGCTRDSSLREELARSRRGAGL